MPFDPLWEQIVNDWLDYAQNTLGLQPNDPLFPKTLIKNNPETMQFESAGISREHWANASPVRDIFRHGFALAGLPYYNPHSLRKMLIIWAMEHCTQMEFKAISQNLGHEHAMTSYNAYGNLNDHTRRDVIKGIGQGDQELSRADTDALMKEIQRRMKI